MQKKHVLSIGAVGTLLFGFLMSLGTDACYVNATCKSWRGILTDSLIVTIFFPCVLILSLITYKLRDEVFRAWLHFSYWWISLSFILILAASNRPGHLFVSEQEFLGMLLPGLYVTISLVIIVWKHFATRGK